VGQARRISARRASRLAAEQLGLRLDVCLHCSAPHAARPPTPLRTRSHAADHRLVRARPRRLSGRRRTHRGGRQLPERGHRESGRRRVRRAHVDRRFASGLYHRAAALPGPAPHRAGRDQHRRNCGHEASGLYGTGLVACLSGQTRERRLFPYSSRADTFSMRELPSSLAAGPAPVVTSVEPTHALPGATITVSGDNFRPSGITVTVAALSCSNVVVAADGRSLTCATSSVLSPGTTNVAVNNGDLTAGSLAGCYVVQGR